MLATFQRVVLSIFSNLILENVEVFMDDFTTFGDEFEKSLAKLEKVLQTCIEYDLSLSDKKIFF